MIAAPLAAYLVKVAPAHLLGVAVGGVILLTNARTLFRAYEVAEMIRIVCYVAILLVAVVGLNIAASGRPERGGRSTSWSRRRSARTVVSPVSP